MKSLYLFGLCFWIAVSSAIAQNITGKVQEKNTSGVTTPIIGANVYWYNTTIGVQTDVNGMFVLPASLSSTKLIVSFIGYKPDTLELNQFPTSSLVFNLEPDNTLKEVTVTGNSGKMDRLSPIHTEIIDTRELQKAACCNLSESFETNASVTVSFSDAVTGSKQIQMLGLSGNYVQTNIENMPSIRGLASTFGLNFVPGTWVQSIDVGKGVGSVVNGYESIAGQINVELKKPDQSEKLYFNTYVNNFGRAEVNLNTSHQLSDKWSMGVMTHASTLQNRIDKNKDNFLDLPLYNQFNGMARWKYQTDQWVGQFGVKALHENRLGGEKNFEKEMKNTTQAYGFGANINRYEVFGKLAKLFPHKPYQGVGLIVNGTLHDQKSYFGLTNYNGKQATFYSNLIYQSIIGNSNHNYRTGVSYMLDTYNEVYRDSTFKRNESVPGVFFEYTYTDDEGLTLVAGARADHHNLYGTQFTPRLHLKYHLHQYGDIRLAAGRGFRVANPISEHYGHLASARRVVFQEQINPEVAWNYGISYMKDFQMGSLKGNFVIDYFRTDFKNQLVGDLEDYRYIKFYNLKGKAYANSFQAEVNLKPIQRMEMKLAYRLYDNKQTLTSHTAENLLLPKMMVSRDRVLFNIGYALPYDKWKYDLTVQWNGKRRMPHLNAEGIHDTSLYMVPDYFNINAQITRTFVKWDIYLGGENLNNFTQKNPIIDSFNPFGTQFDASMAWGPVIGRMIYAGVRFKIGE